MLKRRPWDDRRGLNDMRGRLTTHLQPPFLLTLPDKMTYEGFVLGEGDAYVTQVGVKV